MAKSTHVVSHPRMYMHVDGKLQHVPKGTQVALSAEQAKKYGKKVLSLAEAKTVEIGAKEPAAKEPTEK